MSILNELMLQREVLEAYWETTSSIGIILLDPSRNILDCNQGFTRMFQLQAKPVGLPVAQFLELGAEDLKEPGELKLGCSSRYGAAGIIHCHVKIAQEGHLLICERHILTESSALELVGVINNELVNLQRETATKNLLLERLKKESDRHLAEIKATLDRVRQLEGILPICMYCKKIRDGEHSWHQLEQYISEHSDAEFTHSLCPACYQEQLELADKWRAR
jgi:PAS domain-containing protein